MEITLDEVQMIQRVWTHSIVKKDVETLIDLYHHEATLRPTFSRDMKTSLPEIREYYQGPEDKSTAGFLDSNYQEVKVLERMPKLLGETAVDMGKYQFIGEHGEQLIADITFVYRKHTDGTIKIVSHHLSTEYLH